MSGEVVELRSASEWRRAWSSSELRCLEALVEDLEALAGRFRALLEELRELEVCKRG